MGDHHSFTLIKDDLVFFRGEKSLCSNFYRSPFTDPETGYRFLTVEHYYQFHKALYSGDQQSQLEILRTDEAYKVQRIGHQIKNLNRSGWEERKISVLYKGLKLKFSDPILKNKLREYYVSSPTNRKFIEISKSNYWGCSYKMVVNNSKNADLYGRNNMGKLLTKLDNELFQ
uniref:DUF1768 domain-containing protein n=1 Tax=Strongyloides papillosus TaxID=174720 RepID=A0A0N5CBD7_STREA